VERVPQALAQIPVEEVVLHAHRVPNVKKRKKNLPTLIGTTTNGIGSTESKEISP
jgi:adenylosuccinate synthase